MLYAATYIDQYGIHRTWTGGLTWGDAHREDSDLRTFEPDARGYEVVPQYVADARQGKREGMGITDAQITALRSEAGAAGDSEMVAICDRAIEGDDAARAECSEAVLP